jgi:uncharacterized protein (DUF924 family)
MTPAEIIDFWFSETARAYWFRSTPEFDREVGSRFATTWSQARVGQLADWEQTAEGALALVLLLDQFPLNMFRDRPEGFSTEAASRAVAGRAIVRGLDASLPDTGKAFLYLPYMHSESLADQDRAVELFEQARLEDNLKWARHHREIVRRFGRFPHRNAILGRASTPEETAWLDSPEGFSP